MRYSSETSLTFGHYPFVYLSGFLITGILAGNLLPWSFASWMLLFTLSFCTGLFFCFFKTTHPLVPKLRTLILLSCFLFAGGLLHQQHDIRNDPRWYGHKMKSAEAFLINVSGNPEYKSKTLFIPADVIRKKTGDHWVPATGALHLYLYLKDSMPEINVHTNIIIPNQLAPVQNSGNPFAFDYAAYLQRNNIIHQAFLSPDKVLIFPAKSEPGLISSLRKHLISSIERNIPDSTTAALIEATLLNERTLLQNDVWQAYSVTGIAHIIAISGMHVSMLFGVLLFLLKWMKNKRLKWIKYFIALPLVWLYIILTGFPPSAVRAAVMFTLLAIRIKTQGEQNNINILAATAFILLVYNPGWLFDTGIQLSFSAVLSIFIFYEPIRKSIRPGNKIILYLWEIISVSLAAQVLVFPLVIYYFHQFPAWVILANIPAVCYSFLLMSGSLLLFLLDMLSMPVSGLGKTLIYMTHGFHRIIFFFAGHTPPFMRQFFIGKIDFWLLMLAVICFSIYFLRKKAVVLFAGLGVLCILACSFILQDYMAFHQKRIVVYNSSKTALIDFFSGKKHERIALPDSIAGPKTYRYNLLPARLGYRAMQPITNIRGDQIWHIRNKTILYLHDNFRLKGKAFFQVDYLILSENCDYNLQFWNDVFMPKEIILDGSFTRWKAKKWEARLTDAGIVVHNVSRAGAWVFPQNQAHKSRN